MAPGVRYVIQKYVYKKIVFDKNQTCMTLTGTGQLFDLTESQSAGLMSANMIRKLKKYLWRIYEDTL